MPPANVEQWIKTQRLNKPLCFTAVDAGATIAFNKYGSPDEASIVTSTDGQNWTPYEFNTIVILANIGDKIYFRAEDENDISFYKDNNNYYRFATTTKKKIAASGNIQTLMKADGSRLDIYGKNNCYKNMFVICRSLTAAPELPATTLANRCYSQMFYGCSKLASINVNFTAWIPTDATNNWLNGVAASGTFTCPSALPNTRGNNNIPSSWTKVVK